MCGIAGWLGALPDNNGLAERLAQALHHRGPDARGTRSWPGATLIHTRLSIIDLSSTGLQPMANEHGTVWTVFNGEIYNHRELRRHLEGRGHVFRGRSDAEVLPHLYEEEGAALVAKLRGMFALAIYDTRTRTLTLARDRFGIKPLFYAAENNRLMFASEIRALLSLPGIDDRPDRQAIYDFAALCYIPAPETFYAGIRALQPGEILEARLEDRGVSWRTRLYHQWAIHPDAAMTLPEAAEQTEALVTAAVKRQIESDVPLGALLSGGIDSSLVTAAAQAAFNGGVRTFNVRFSEREYDETWSATAVAKHIGSNHQTLHMNDIRGTWSHIKGLLLHAGQPFADTSLFAVNAICRLMRQHVTVALSGDGGDEAFGGYSVYSRISSVARLQPLPPAIWHAAAAMVTPLAHVGIVSERLPLKLRSLAGADDAAVILNLTCPLKEEEQRSLCRDTDLLPVRRLFEPQWEHHLPPRASRLERLSAHATEIITRLRLPNCFLFKVDTASMKESLEVRVPMLDEELFAFGLKLPHRLKASGRTCKMVLREVARQKLPVDIANKPKHGFEVPLELWGDTDFKARMSEALLGPSSKLPEFFRPEVYSPMVTAFCEGRPYRGLPQRSLTQVALMLLSAHLALDGLKE